MKLAEHPTVRHFHENAGDRPVPPTVLDAAWLRQLCLDCGADDAGLVEISRPALDDQRDDILRVLPAHQDAPQLRLPDEPGADPQPGPVGRQPRIPPHRRSRQRGRPQDRGDTGAAGRSGGEPGDGLPDGDGPLSGGKIWVVSHKPVAVAAGLGHMGIHRNVIHPKFGNFILLGTVLIAAEATAYDQPLAYNPCLECKLCVAACPVGAISPDGDFNFSACYTHNYREFMGGFTDWVEQIADSKNALDYRKRVADPESASMWQSLSFGANYKAAYCLASARLGRMSSAPISPTRPGICGKSFVRCRRRKRRSTSSPARTPRSMWPAASRTRRSNGSATACGPGSIQRFLSGLPLTFQPGKAAKLNAVYHFTFTGKEEKQATVTIRDGTLQVQDGHQGEADLRVTADSETWLGFLAKERSLLWALLRRRIRIKGSPKLLVAFGKCFPS